MLKQQPNHVNLAAGRVDPLTFPFDKARAFLWNTDTLTLALRATFSGRKTNAFEARLNGSTLRLLSLLFCKSPAVYFSRLACSCGLNRAAPSPELPLAEIRRFRGVAFWLKRKCFFNLTQKEPDTC
jgi:hypothetical protein